MWACHDAQLMSYLSITPGRNSQHATESTEHARVVLNDLTWGCLHRSHLFPLTRSSAGREELQLHRQQLEQHHLQVEAAVQRHQVPVPVAVSPDTFIRVSNVLRYVLKLVNVISK